MLKGMVVCCVVALAAGCGPAPVQQQFSDITDVSGIQFENHFKETDSFNIFQFMNMYNGGGVAIADLNNDGLKDIFFTANQLPDQLYLNRGDLHFENVSEIAGIGGKPGWKTGVSMADVNGDGQPDIYVCYSGLGDAAYRANQLFIHKGLNKDGVPVFEEQAAAYGIDAPGTNSNQSVFFDFDKDGDLDLFLLNHATTFYSPFFNTSKLRTKRHPAFSHRFYRNDGGHFTDISETVGLKGGGNTFGLGVMASDINDDGWPDLYMTNDFEEQDYFLLNNRKGGFIDVTKDAFGHISRYGMGCDIADYNNDGRLDIFVADMLPEGNERQKLLKGPDQYDKYNLLVDSGYFHQNMRNTLQLNRGISRNGVPVFSEIGQLAGVSNTDWSWSPLFADLDNDGYRDLFITNGYWRDFTNLDFSNYVVNEYQAVHGRNQVGMEVMEHLSQTRLMNYVFRNRGDLGFENVTEAYGLTALTCSNGAAYADLDNDGDLDLVVNNIGEKAKLYRNNSRELQPQSHYLAISLRDTGMNRYAIGARVRLEAGGNKWMAELFPVRGFLSCMAPELHFGLGADSIVQKLEVDWPDGSRSVWNNIAANQRLVLEHEKAGPAAPLAASPEPAQYFKDISAESGLDFEQRENRYVDFKQEPLIPWQLSKQGPRLAVSDVNGDGLDDVFAGGASGFSGCLFLQTKPGQFSRATSQPWKADSLCEDLQSVFFDADQDGDPDLLVLSGGNELHGEATAWQDRLYLNNGRGVFTKARGMLPVLSSSKGCVAITDYNRDGLPDLFIGGSVVPGQFGLPPRSYLLKNVGTKGKPLWKEDTAADAAGLTRCGMTRDANWTDLNGDGWPDLLVVGEWMPVCVFMNEKGVLKKQEAGNGLEKSGGLWTRILPADMDGDGDTDFILGNLAPNTQFRVSAAEPMTLCVGDFLQSGQAFPILCYYMQGKSYPYASRDELTEVMPILKKKFLKYASYANAVMEDIFPAAAIAGSKKLEVHTLKNSWLENAGNGKLILRELPLAAQFSPVQGAVFAGQTEGGRPWYFMAGNFFPFRVQLGREDAGAGFLLSLDAAGKYAMVQPDQTGVVVDGDIRDVVSVHCGREDNLIVVAKNSGKLQTIKKIKDHANQ